jgi:hypothetical protein
VSVSESESRRFGPVGVNRISRTVAPFHVLP